MSNFTPLPGSWRRGSRAYDGHNFNFNHRESNEVPVFYRSHSTHATVSLLYSCFSAKISRTSHRRQRQIKFMFIFLGRLRRNLNLCSWKQRMELSLFEDDSLYIILVHNISRMTEVQVCWLKNGLGTSEIL